MGITSFIAESITALIAKTGYISVTFLMMLESMVVPLPSEAIMPFAGFLVQEGKFTFLLVALAATTGSIIGSLISYCIGYYGGKPFIHKFGKYVFLNTEHLEITEHFFHKHGEITVLICRFIPVVRHLSSIPAGVGRMNLMRFVIFTAIGATIWNSFLCYVGYILRSNWAEIMKYSHVADICVVIAGCAAVIYFFYKHYMRLKRKAV